MSPKIKLPGISSSQRSKYSSKEKYSEKTCNKPKILKRNFGMLS
jgi:hypothetical protein